MISEPDLGEPSPTLRGLHTANIHMREPVITRPAATARNRVSFITISRQAGAEGGSLPYVLAQAINEHQPPTEPKWSVWDRELLDRVAAEHNIDETLVEAVERPGYAWLDDFFAGLGARPDRLMILRRIEQTVRELARAGHVILVGHGSTFMTYDLPGALRLMLVAPLAARIDTIARSFDAPHTEATTMLRQMERSRRSFRRRFWPNQNWTPDFFAATLNTAALDQHRLIEAALALAGITTGKPQTQPAAVTRPQ